MDMSRSYRAAVEAILPGIAIVFDSKVFFFDIGIAHRILGLDLAEWVTHPF
jgi:hypothetical protein